MGKLYIFVSIFSLFIIYMWLCRFMCFQAHLFSHYPIIFNDDYGKNLLQEISKYKSNITNAVKSRIEKTLFNNDHAVNGFDCFNKDLSCVVDDDCLKNCTQPSYLFKCHGHKCRMSNSDFISSKNFNCEKRLGCEKKVEIINGLSVIKPYHRFPFINPTGNLLNPITFKNATLNPNFTTTMNENDAVICNHNFLPLFSKYTSKPQKFCIQENDPIKRTFNV